MKVEQLMTREVHTCGPDDTLDVAARILWDHDVGVVPIVRGEQGVGMLSDRDVCMAAYTQGRPLHEISVSSVMSGDLFGCAPEASLEDALRLMGEHQVRRLPVLDAERRLQGLITMNDITREALRAPGRVNARQVLETLGAVGRSREAAAAPAPMAVSRLVAAV